MTSSDLFDQILAKRSFLCVGLDSDTAKLPPQLASIADGQFEFNRRIVDATAKYTIAYKPNLAFYEQNGAEGWISFERTCRYIREQYPRILIIADAKRGDIGNTSRMYAEAFFKTGLVDAVTLSPYMGRDTVAPFLRFDGKWAVVLALTSNPSADDFETLRLESGGYLYEQVIRESSKWGSTDNTMYVVGATRASTLSDIRAIVPDHFLLIPGVGAQGGSLEEVAAYGMNSRCGLIVNSSRAIIFADGGEGFASAAEREAESIRDQMDLLLSRHLPLQG